MLIFKPYNNPLRRDILKGLGVIGTACILPSFLPGTGFSQSSSAQGSHGLSMFGDLLYPTDFKHFNYVRPDAPKGGTLSLQVSSTSGNQTFDTFNTLNIYVLRGDGAAGMDMIFDSLMSRSADEPDAMYGLVAQSVSASADGLTYQFRLRPQARFHDGSRMTAHDAAFSFQLLKDKGHPRISQSLAFFDRAEALDDETLNVYFKPNRGRDLPMIIAGLPIFSRAFYTKNNFEAASLEPPLGSGAYKVGQFEQGRFISFDRVPDYWAKDVPVNVGLNNFDHIRYEYFRDRQVAFEAFKAGIFNFREEFTSRVWATGYDFPAIRQGRVTRESLPDRSPSGTQGWFFNLRREIFADARVREAIGLAFDFAWTNKTIMFGSYDRTVSYFENSPMKAEGMPSQEELQLLEPWRAQLPANVFSAPYIPPTSDGSGQDRTLLRRASELLASAGCKREKDGLRLANGKKLEIEFLDFQSALEPHTQPFVKNLGLLGITANIRIVDAAQYQRRTDEFDFDITSRRINMGLTPGEGLRQMFGSKTASISGSANLSGISHPAIDAIIEQIINAKTRDDLTLSCRALDRILRAGHYWVPMWYKPSHWLSYWNIFSRPETAPKLDTGAPSTWWHDAAKAKNAGVKPDMKL